MQRKYLSIIIIVIFTINNCVLHYAKVSVKKDKEDDSPPPNIQIPINLSYNPLEERKRMENNNLKFGYSLSVKKDDSIFTYSSEEILAKFKSNNNFIISKDANIKIEITPNLNKISGYLLFSLGYTFTLGVIPGINDTSGSIEFKLHNNESGEYIKSYRYTINHKAIDGFLPIFIGPILPSFSESFDHSLNGKSYSVMRVSFNQFHSDLMKDLEKDKIFRKQFTVSDPGNYIISYDPGNKIKDKKFDEFFLSKIEEMFINNNYNFLDRKKTDSLATNFQILGNKISKEKITNIRKLTGGDHIIHIQKIRLIQEEEEIELKISCISLKTGNILWSETTFVRDEVFLEEAINDTLDELQIKLQYKGVI
ncbi:MAG: hypothetical protein KDK36_03530 [Leptospiraceae bacterium]|nr:hypothetical protein [Leptospiraceae bacterium]